MVEGMSDIHINKMGRLTPTTIIVNFYHNYIDSWRLVYKLFTASPRWISRINIWIAVTRHTQCFPFFPFFSSKALKPHLQQAQVDLNIHLFSRWTIQRNKEQWLDNSWVYTLSEPLCLQQPLVRIQNEFHTKGEKNKCIVLIIDLSKSCRFFCSTLTSQIIILMQECLTKTDTCIFSFLFQNKWEPWSCFESLRVGRCSLIGATDSTLLSLSWCMAP